MTINPELIKESLNEVEVIKDKYVQLILLQYALKAIDLQITANKQSLTDQFMKKSPWFREQKIEDIITLEKVSYGLSLWSQELNKRCPNPES
ncbi:hypothetical protein EOPP23_06770 [Endozoicomonas sp. OPT23]|uniref:hypothetical protein n=1 Tax=Endozoicomonas sp. OPT23 TaxID=2072845 RepID=UPI00129AE959|nr:hypothetical protein [Endozoicomonas sp. OPT23]MRI32688.1 hypothetical protein [Endozoicomonas sp. OPT23]